MDLTGQDAAQHIEEGFAAVESAKAQGKAAKEAWARRDAESTISCGISSKLGYELGITHFFAALEDDALVDPRYHELLTSNIALLLEEAEAVRDVLRDAEASITPSSGAAATSVAAAPMSAESIQKRSKPVWEMLDYERVYLDNLKSYVKMYVHPLKHGKGKHLSSSTLSKAQFSAMFGTVEQLVPLHSMLLEALEARITTSPDPCVGDIYKRYAPFFNMYKPYCSNFEAASKLVSEQMETNKSFRAFISSQAQSASTGGLALQSFMIRPVQHIPRYRLLIQALLKKTPEQHPDHEQLTEALELVKGVAKGINKTIDDYEKRVKLYDIMYKFSPPFTSIIAPHREYVKEGSMEVSTNKSRFSSQEVFLFNDVVVTAGHETFGSRLKHSKTIIISSVEVVEGKEGSKQELQFKIVGSKGTVLTCQAATVRMRNEWVEAIRNITHENRRKRQSISVAMQQRNRGLSAAGGPGSPPPMAALPEEQPGTPQGTPQGRPSGGGGAGGMAGAYGSPSMQISHADIAAAADSAASAAAAAAADAGARATLGRPPSLPARWASDGEHAVHVADMAPVLPPTSVSADGASFAAGLEGMNLVAPVAPSGPPADAAASPGPPPSLPPRSASALAEAADLAADGDDMPPPPSLPPRSVSVLEDAAEVAAAQAADIDAAIDAELQQLGSVDSDDDGGFYAAAAAEAAQVADAAATVAVAAAGAAAGGAQARVEATAATAAAGAEESNREDSAAPPPLVERRCQAVDDFDAEEEGQLSVVTGDELTLVAGSIGDAWITVQDALGMVGSIPSAVVRVVQDEYK